MIEDWEELGIESRHRKTKSNYKTLSAAEKIGYIFGVVVVMILLCCLAGIAIGLTAWVWRAVL